MVYHILSTGLASLALRRLPFVISDFRPPSVTESNKPLFRKIPANRAFGVYLLTSDDPAPGSQTVFSSCSTTGFLKCVTAE